MTFFWRSNQIKEICARSRYISLTSAGWRPWSGRIGTIRHKPKFYQESHEIYYNQFSAKKLKLVVNGACTVFRVNQLYFDGFRDSDLYDLNYI